MADRRTIYTDPDTGFPFEITSETELFGQGGLAARPASGVNTGDLFVLSEQGTTQLQRWNGSSWEFVTSPPGGTAGGGLEGTYPNPTIKLSAIPGGVFGGNFSTFESTQQLTTTSTTFQTYATFSLPAGTLPAAGTYRVGALWQYANTANGTRVESRLLINTGTSKTKVDDTPGNGQTRVGIGIDYFAGTLNTAAITFSVQYRRVSGTGSAVMRYALFELWRVA